MKRVGSSIVALKQSAVIGPTPGTVSKPADLHIMTCQLVNLTVEIVDLLLDGLARLKQRPHCSNQLGTILDQLCGSRSKDIELATADTQGFTKEPMGFGR